MVVAQRDQCATEMSLKISSRPSAAFHFHNIPKHRIQQAFPSHQESTRPANSNTLPTYHSNAYWTPDGSCHLISWITRNERLVLRGASSRDHQNRPAELARLMSTVHARLDRQDKHVQLRDVPRWCHQRIPSVGHGKRFF